MATTKTTEPTIEAVPEPTPELGAPAPRLPSEPIRCVCGEMLVDIEPLTGETLLRVWERQLLRPHLLTLSDLPLAWACPKCSAVTNIG